MASNSADSFLEREQVHFSEESVKASIGLSSLSHETSKSECLLLTVDFTLSINLSKNMSESLRFTYISDLNLNGSVIIGDDQRVGGRAFSWDVKIHNFVFVVLHF